MRNKLLVCLLLAGQIAYAASFTATVEDNNITFGNSLQLKLQLEDAKVTGTLDLSPLTKDFTIYHQQQFSSYSNINGKVTAENGWHVTLMPKNVGEFVIPAVSVVTDKGLLKTSEFKVTVQAAQAGAKNPDSGSGISLIATVNKSKIFVNEPVIYTLKIISYKPIVNVVLDDIKSNDAIIEKIGEPKQYDQTHGGVRAHIIELKYAITALKPGAISIAPATMHGEIQVPTQAQRSARFGVFNNLFFDNMFELKPFSLQTEVINLDIMPPVTKMQNWLPLANLTVTQTWDNTQDVKVGDTITRKIKLVAKGGFGKQLPSVKDFMPQTNVKIYANKPNFNDRFEAETVVGVREEEYSIVPQAEGSISFPEIQIKWWNLRTNKMEVSSLPAKTIAVTAAATNVAPGVTLDYSQNEQPAAIIQPETTSTANNVPTWVYALIGFLAGIAVILGLALTWVLLRKRPGKISKPKTCDSKIVVHTADDLRKVILQYAIKHWHVPADISLNRLGDALATNHYSYNLDVYTNITQYINASIYAKVNMDLSVLMTQWDEFRKSVVKTKAVDQTLIPEPDYSSLNPT